jgi:putative peptide zinc metalloprotease protein
VGIVADLDHLHIRAVAGQRVAGRLITEAKPLVEMRIKGRPDIRLTGRIETIIPAGYDELPSASLGYTAGGTTQVDLEDPSGRRTAEPFFEILVVPDSPEKSAMLPGQTMVLRFDTAPKPLLEQGWRSLLQLFQRRFQV